MKRAGGLWGQICDAENLRLAFWKAAKGKRDREGVRRFAANLAAEIEAMRAGLQAATYPIGRFTQFKVFEPKERTIHAAAFPERVVHHAILNVCEPVFERWLIPDTFACRRGKGRLAAIARARQFAGRYPWFLKMDVRRCFESLSHDVLLGLLARKFRERELLALFARIVGSHQPSPGRGLPIGSLTSQHFANAYLGLLDRFVKQELRCEGYVRYMDDFVVWAGTKAELGPVRDAVRQHLHARLALEFKVEPCPQPTERGMDFLGFRIFPNATRLSRRSKRRFMRRCRSAERAHTEGRLTWRGLQTKVMALLAFVRHADSAGFRRRWLSRFGDGPQGSNRVNRGGSWNNDAANCRSANRNNNEPGNRNNNLGFRLALAPQLIPRTDVAG